MNPEQKWDFEFYTSFIPIFLEETTINELWFERILHSLSEFDHRCHSMLLELPSRFTIKSMQESYSCSREVLETISKHIRKYIYTLSETVKTVKFQKNQLEDNFNKGINELKKHDLRIAQLTVEMQMVKEKITHYQQQKIPSIIFCQYEKTTDWDREYQHHQLKRNQQILRNQLDQINDKIQYEQKTENSKLVEVNNVIRNEVEILNQAMNLLLNSNYEQPFSTFQKRGLNAQPNLIKDPEVSDFKSVQLEDLIDKAVRKGEEEHSIKRKIPENMGNFFQAAVQAESQEMPSEAVYADRKLAQN